MYRLRNSHRISTFLMRMISVLILISLLLPAYQPALAQRAVTASITLSPSSLRPGGVTSVTGSNLTPGQPFFLSAPCIDGSPIGVDSGRDGVFDQKAQVTLTAPAPGTCKFTLTAAIGGLVVAEASLTLLESMSLTLIPTSGAPGTTIQFTATNLAPGSMLRLDYAEAPVFGPAPVGGSPYPWPAKPVNFSGSFIVPADRSSPLGGTIPVTATNLSGSTVLGKAVDMFTTKAAIRKLQFSFSDMNMAAPLITAGAPFTITGRLTPPPDANTHIASLYTEGMTRTIPLDSDLTLLDDLGNFQLTGNFPDLRAGDAMVPGTQGMINVTAYSDSDNGNLYEIPASPPAYRPPLNVVVKASDTGQPIPGAVVVIMAAPDQNYSGGLSMADVSLFNGENQVSGWAWDHGVLNEINTTDGKLTDLLCDTRTVAITNDKGEHTYSNIDSFTELLTDHQALMQSILEKVTSDYKASVTTPMLSFTYPENLGPDLINDPIEVEAYIVTADALIYGYGNVDEVGVPFPAYEVVYYNPASATWYDHGFHILPGNTLNLLENPLPEGYQFKIDSIYPTFSDYYTLYGFAGVEGADLSQLPKDQVSVKLTMLDWTVSHYIDRIEMRPPDGAPFNLAYAKGQNEGSKCEAQGPMMGYFYGTYDLDMSTLWPGKLYFQVVVYPKPGFGQPRTIEYSLDVYSIPDWFRDTSILNRTVTSSYPALNLRGKYLDASSNSQELTGSLPNYGNVNNKVATNMEIHGTLESNDYQENRWGSIKSTVLDKPSNTSMGLSGSAVSSTGLAGTYGQEFSDYCPDPGVAVIPIQQDWQLLFDTGHIDLAVIPVETPLGEAKVSVGFQFSAGMAYDGYIQPVPPASCLAVIPDSQIITDFAAEVHFLWVIAAGGAHTWIKNREYLTTVYQNGNVSFPYDWGYRGDVRVWWGLLCACDSCLIHDHHDENIYCNNYGCGKTSTQTASASQELKLTEYGPAAPSQYPGDPLDARVSLATDGDSQVMELAAGYNSTIITHLFDGLNWGMTSTINTTGIYPIDTDLAFYDTGKAVAIWSESNLALTKDISATPTMTDAYQSYHMAYSLWDGTKWSTGQDLAASLSVDAQGTITGCPASDPACPAGGAAIAVWSHDRASSLSQPAYNVKFASFDGNTSAWTKPGAVALDEVTFKGSDTQPAAVYARQLPADASLRPFVAWIRDDDRSYNTLANRTLAARWLGFCGLSDCPMITGLPSGIMQFSIGTTPEGIVKLAFTRAENGAGAIDTRHTLYTAEMGCIPSLIKGMPPTCSWQHIQRLLDAHGRGIYGQDPNLTIDIDGRPTLTFRGLGFAPDASGNLYSYPEDALGMTIRRGELAQVELDFTSPSVGLHYLTNDAAFNWNVSALYVPQYDQTLALAVRGQPPALTTQQLSRLQPEAARVSAVTPAQANQGVAAFTAVPREPDFELVSALPSTFTPQQGEPLTVDASIRNNALDWITGTLPLSVTASWDGPSGLGKPAGAATLAHLGAGETVSLTLSLDLLDLNFVDFAHTLYITVNPAQNIPELSPANNTRTLSLGDMQAPDGVTASVEQGKRLVSVHWLPASDPRLIGYRIYRSEGNGPFEPVGTSFVPGFVDVTAKLDKQYRYAVTFYTAHGLESPLSMYYPVATHSFWLFLPIATTKQ